MKTTPRKHKFTLVSRVKSNVGRNNSDGQVTNDYMYNRKRRQKNQAIPNENFGAQGSIEQPKARQEVFDVKSAT